MLPVTKALLLLLLAPVAFSGCSGDDLDCSLGVMKASCPSGTVGFDRMEAKLRRAERLCVRKGLQPGGDAYSACLAAEGPIRSPPSVTPFYHIGPS